MAKPTMVCTACGGQGSPKRVVKGSLGLEIVLWLLLLVPGMIYSVWRLTSRYDACPHCGAAGMIPLNSPRGQQIARELA